MTAKITLPVLVKKLSLDPDEKLVYQAFSKNRKLSSTDIT